MSHVTFHLHTCHMSHVFSFIFSQIVPASWLRVCYQWGLPRLVCNESVHWDDLILELRCQSVCVFACSIRGLFLGLPLHCIALHWPSDHMISFQASHWTMGAWTIELKLLRCRALYCIALHCITLHCIALHCIALHSPSDHMISFQASHWTMGAVLKPLNWNCSGSELQPLN